MATSDDDERRASSQRVLDALEAELEVPASRRIYTNRDLAFDEIAAIGFDMDYTLALYRQGALDDLSVEVTVAKLIAQGYPPILAQLQRDPHFAVRGLIVDTKHGNLLKVDRHGYVGRAFHGARRLDHEERRALYRGQRISTQRERFAYVDTLFSLPEVDIYAALVEMIDAQPQLWPQGAPTYAQAWEDVRESIDLAHRDDSIKAKVKADPGAYLKDDPDLAATLHKLRSAGKRLLLITNSLFDYCDPVMRWLLDGRLEGYDEWTRYFDYIVVGSAKPAFFTGSEPFWEVDPATGQLASKGQRVPQKGKIYQGGHQGGLQEALDCFADQVLYVGDHIYGDIVKSKKSSGWRTVLVVEDLEHDVAVRRDYFAELREIEALIGLRNRVHVEIGKQRHVQRVLAKLTEDDLRGLGITGDTAAVLEETRVRARARFDRLREHQSALQLRLDRMRGEVGAAFNPHWGSVWAERFDASLFGTLAESYACLYTSRVSNFFYVSPTHLFHADHGSLAHW